MNVVLDTTAFHPWGATLPQPTERIFAAAKARDLRVFVPEVVVIECVRHFEKTYVKPAKAKLETAENHARKAGLPATVAGVDASAVRDAVAQYEADFRQRLSDYGVEVLPLPAVSHAEILDRLRTARRPSQWNDSSTRDADGYRDVLIWYSVLELLERTSGSVVLVTSNHDDFGVAQNSAEVHPDLAADLTDRGHAADAVALVPMPRDLVAMYLAAGDAALARIEAVLQDSERQRELRDVLQGLLEGADPGSIGAPYESELEYAAIGERPTVEDVRLVGVYEWDKGEAYGVSLDVEVTSDVDFIFTSPTAWDLARAGAEVEGDSGGGGYIHSTHHLRLRLPVDLGWSVAKDDWLTAEDDVTVGEGEDLDRTFEARFDDDDIPPEYR